MKLKKVKKIAVTWKMQEKISSGEQHSLLKFQSDNSKEEIENGESQVK